MQSKCNTLFVGVDYDQSNKQNVKLNNKDNTSKSNVINQCNKLMEKDDGEKTIFNIDGISTVKYN